MNKVYKWIYTQREKESGWAGRSLWKKLWKSLVNDANFGSVFLIKFLYWFIFIKFLTYEFLLWELKLVCPIFVFASKIKLLESSQKWFYFTKKVPFILRIFKFCTSLFPSFFIVCHCWFYRIAWLMISCKVFGTVMSLNWIKKTQILYYLMK